MHSVISESIVLVGNPYNVGYGSEESISTVYLTRSLFIFRLVEAASETRSCSSQPDDLCVRLVGFCDQVAVEERPESGLMDGFQTCRESSHAFRQTVQRAARASSFWLAKLRPRHVVGPGQDGFAPEA